MPELRRSRRLKSSFEPRAGGGGELVRREGSAGLVVDHVPILAHLTDSFATEGARPSPPRWAGCLLAQLRAPVHPIRSEMSGFPMLPGRGVVSAGAKWCRRARSRGTRGGAYLPLRQAIASAVSQRRAFRCDPRLPSTAWKPPESWEQNG